MLPLTNEQLESLQERLATEAARHGFQMEGFHVLVPGLNGETYECIDMSAADPEKFLPSLMYLLRKQWMTAGGNEVRLGFSKMMEPVAA